MNNSKQIVLITGSSGFIGRTLCDHLKNHQIPIRQVIRQQRAGQNDEVLEIGEINGTTDWAPILSGVSEVIHLAATHHVFNERGDGVEERFKKVNIDGTLNLARQAISEGVHRFIYLSSIKVNGEETFEKPFTPRDKPAPLDHYGKSKLAAENGLKEIAKETCMEIVIIRPPLVYGREASGNFARLRSLVEKGIPLPFGNVTNKRSLVGVENLCDLIRICLKHPRATEQPILVSDGQDVSTTELISLLARYSNKPVRLVRMPNWVLLLAARVIGKSLEIKRLTSNLQVDISETRKILGWKPKQRLEKGIERSVS